MAKDIRNGSYHEHAEEIQDKIQKLDSDGNLTGDVTGSVTGDLTGNILSTAATGESGSGLVGTGAELVTARRQENGVIITTIKIDLKGLASVGTTEDAIGLAAGGVAKLGQYVTANYGIVFKAELSCLQTPVGGATDIDIATNATGTIAYDGAVSTAKLINGASLTAGKTVANLIPAMTANHYLYIVEGTGSAGTYTAGQFILTLYGHALLA